MLQKRYILMKVINEFDDFIHTPICIYDSKEQAEEDLEEFDSKIEYWKTMLPAIHEKAKEVPTNYWLYEDNLVKWMTYGFFKSVWDLKHAKTPLIIESKVRPDEGLFGGFDPSGFNDGRDD